VNQGILLSKLNCNEIKGKTEEWFESYLKNKKKKKQRVEIKMPNSKCNTYKKNSGIVR